MNAHVNTLLDSCARTIYGLHLLRVHSMSEDCIKEVFRSTVLAKLVYASPAWSGFCSASDVKKLERLINRCNVLTIALRPLHVSQNSLIKLTNLSSTLLYLTIIMYCIASCQLSKANNTNLGLELTVSPRRTSRPFTITVINALLFVTFCFVSFNAVCYCSIKPIWWWWWLSATSLRDWHDDDTISKLSNTKPFCTIRACTNKDLWRICSAPLEGC